MAGVSAQGTGYIAWIFGEERAAGFREERARLPFQGDLQYERRRQLVGRGGELEIRLRTHG